MTITKGNEVGLLMVKRTTGEMTRRTDEKNLNYAKLEIGEAAKQRGGVADD